VATRNNRRASISSKRTPVETPILKMTIIDNYNQNVTNTINNNNNDNKILDGGGGGPPLRSPRESISLKLSQEKNHFELLDKFRKDSIGIFFIFLFFFLILV
jgi:hypothetical protein